MANEVLNSHHSAERSIGMRVSSSRKISALALATGLGLGVIGACTENRHSEVVTALAAGTVVVAVRDRFRTRRSINNTISNHANTLDVPRASSPSSIEVVGERIADGARAVMNSGTAFFGYVAANSVLSALLSTESQSGSQTGSGIFFGALFSYTTATTYIDGLAGLKGERAVGMAEVSFLTEQSLREPC